MKFRYQLILSIIITLFTISCNNIDSHINSNFEIFELDTNQISLDSFGNYVDLNISSNNDWEIDSIPNWIQISEIKGSGNATLSIGADEHRSIEERNIDITFSHLSGVDTLRVKQNGIEEYIFSVDSKIKSFTNEGNEVELSIETDGLWSIISDCDWVEIIPSEGEGSSIVKIKASINDQEKSRVDSCLVNSDIIGVNPLKIKFFQDGSMGSFIKDSLALVALYNELLDGTIPWDINSPISTWEGVTLDLRDGENRVTEVKIDTENLKEYSGIERTLFIPELFNMKYIELFDVEGLGDDMIGDIPNKILEWQKLKYLRLVNTNIQEQYTPSIKNLKNLEDLIIYDTFTVTPYCQILTEELSELNKLENIYIVRSINGDNFPEVIFEFENLKSLNLQFYDNFKISTIPDRFNELPNLESITITFEESYVPGNNELVELTSLPISINSCSKLKSYKSNFKIDNFSLDDYPFIGQIKFLDISNIDLSLYTLENIVPYLYSYIQELNLNGCNITGSVSDDIIGLEYLKSLDITSNCLSGTVSDNFLEKANRFYWLINPQQNGINLELYTIDAPVYGELIDERDGNIYKTVIIGEQEWVADNLNYIPIDNSFYHISEGSYWDMLTSIDKAYGHRYNDDKGIEYGCLYTREAAQVVCPEGWHLPSSSEWFTMIGTLADKGHSFDGNLNGNYLNKAISSTEGWNYSNTPSTPGCNPELNNSSGLNVKPSGYMHSFITNSGSSALFWFSSIATNVDNGINIAIHCSEKNNYTYSFYPKTYMMPVRCIKD